MKIQDEIKYLNLHKSKYYIGQIVYLKTDEEQKPRIVIQVTFRQTGARYGLVCGITDSYHDEIEITDEKDYKMI